MKTTKKLLAVALALVLALSLCTVSLAADPTYTITINNSVSGHTYEAYQIFSGDVTVDQGNKILTNVDWGSGINGTEFLTALKSASLTGTYSTCEDAADVAKALGENPGDAEAFAELAAEHLNRTPTGTSTGAGPYTIGNLEAGYYLVKDKDNSTGIDAYTAYILEVVGNVEVDPKSDTTTSEKKVKDINNSTDTAYGNWQDSADHDIGDSIPFRLSATLPDNYDAYEKFAITFHDTENIGLSFTGVTSVYYIKKDQTEQTTIAEAQYSVKEDSLEDINCTFEVQFANLKNITGLGAGDTIYVEYESTLNENAVIGSAGNPNTMYLTYSNNPYSTTDRGRTVDDTVIVFTYKVVVNKVDGQYAPLPGAQFKLEKYNAATTNWDEVETITTGTGANQNIFSFEGLDDGNYRLTETATPAGYNTMEPIEFKVEATHDITSDSPALTDLSGNKLTGEVFLTRNTEDGMEDALETDVVNEKGLVLPTTGGMGTTLFYIGGIVLVLGAASCLIVKLYRKKNI